MNNIDPANKAPAQDINPPATKSVKSKADQIAIIRIENTATPGNASIEKSRDWGVLADDEELEEISLKEETPASREEDLTFKEGVLKYEDDETPSQPHGKTTEVPSQVELKGAKARANVLDELKNSKFDLVTMKSLLEQVETKLNPPRPQTLLGRIRLIAKRFLTNAFANRDKQLSDIKKMLITSLNAKMRGQGPQQIKQIATEIKLFHPKYLREQGILREAGSKTDIDGWMASDRDVSKLMKLDTFAIFTVVKRLAGESLSFHPGELRDIIQKNFKGTFPTSNEGFKELRALVYQAKPGMQNYFELMHEANEFEAENKMTTMNLVIAACPNLDFCEDKNINLGQGTKQERDFLEWLIKNPA